MRTILLFCASSVLALAGGPGAPDPKLEEIRELKACAQMVLEGFMKIPDVRSQRFLGKVSSNTMICRGGEKSLQFRMTPWVDWSQYWGTGDCLRCPRGISQRRARCSAAWPGR